MKTTYTYGKFARFLPPKLFTLVLVILSLVVTLSFAPSPSFTVSDPELRTAGRWMPVNELPLRRDIIGDYSVRVTLNPGDKSALALHVIPDDRLLTLLIDGRPVDLSRYDPSALSDWKSGVVIELDNLTPETDHQLIFGLTNASNPAGLEVRPHRALSLVDLLGVALGLCLLVWALLRHIKLAPVQMVILAAGIAVSITYLSVTDPRTRTFDVYEGGGHRDYIEHIIHEQSLPLPGEGWEYHQPPLYYLIAAAAKSGVVGVDDQSDRWGQILALWFWVIFLVASLGALRMPLCKTSVPLALVSIAVCFWPSGIIHSIRMGNDVPLYAFYALSFFYILKWWRHDTHSHLLWACVWACLALLTKSNAMAVWGVLGSLALLRLWRSYATSKVGLLEFGRPHLALGVIGSFFVFAVAANLGDNIWYYATGVSEDWLLSNVSSTINPQLRVENSPSNYLSMDMATFVKYPFISAWYDEYGRQYFWNYVWRSSLSSEFFFDGFSMQLWGVVNGVLLLLMLASIGVLLVSQFPKFSNRANRRAIYKALPWILAVVFPFLLLLAYRIKVPLSCNTDFRYIYPVIVPLVLGSLIVWKRAGYAPHKVLGVAAPLIGITTIAWLVMLSRAS